MSYRMAKALVFTKIKNSLGLDHCRIFISGAAPLNQETSEFFLSLDIPIGEVYGMSESSGPHTISTPANYKLLRYQSPGQTPGPLAMLGQSGWRWEGFWDMMNPDLVPPASRLQIFMTVGSLAYCPLCSRTPSWFCPFAHFTPSAGSYHTDLLKDLLKHIRCFTSSLPPSFHCALKTPIT